VAPDLPIEDDSAGWAEYADAVVDAIGERTGVVLVAHSLGATGQEQAARDVGIDGGDEIATFLHDVSPERVADAMANARDQSSAPVAARALAGGATGALD